MSKPILHHLFDWCLLKANHKPNKFIWNKEEMIIREGEFITGRFEGSKQTGLKPTTFIDNIDVLVKIGLLWKKSTTKYTHIGIINWDKYQGKLTNSDNKPTTSRQQAVTNKNNNKNDKNNTNVLTPIQEVVNHLFQLKGWDKSSNVIYARFTRPAKQLLELCAGDITSAKGKLEKIAKWAKLKNLDWSIETVFKRWGDLDSLKTEPDKKPYYDGYQMYQKFGKWFVLVDGEHKEFADSEDKIIWK